MNFVINKILRVILRISSIIRRCIYNCVPSISIGANAIIESNVTINTYIGGGTIKIGKNCELRKGCQLLSYGGTLIIGNYVSVNPYTLIYGQGNVIIGNYVRIAAHCVLIPSNHIFEDPVRPIYFQGLMNKGIKIEDDVWIGCGARILDGVTIAKGCVIGAGSVVTKSTEAYGVYAGVPAVKIKSRT